MKTTKSHTILISEWASSQSITSGSADHYEKVMLQFLNFCRNQKYPERELAVTHVIRYIHHLQDQQRTGNTIAHYLLLIKKYFSWCAAEGYYTNIAHGVKNVSRNYNGFRKNPLTIPQVKQLYSSIDTDTMIGKRDYAMINLIVKCGLRVVEVERIDVGDIQDDGEGIMIQGKGHTSKDYYMPITPKVWEPIHEYLLTRDNLEDKDPLFTSLSVVTKGKRLQRKSISDIIKKRLSSIGLTGKMYTAHSLRHTTGVLLQVNGKDLYETQVYMRHSDPKITQLYTRMVEKMMRANNSAGKMIDRVLDEAT